MYKKFLYVTIRKILFIHIRKYRDLLNKESNNRIIKYEKRVSQKNSHHSQFKINPRIIKICIIFNYFKINKNFVEKTILK